MKRVFCIAIFFVSIAYGNVKLNYGIKAGLEQNFYDYKGESFKTKIQFGGGFENFLKLSLNNFFGLEFTFPGFYYLLESDKTGGYLYPDKFKLPLGIGFVFNVDIQKFYFEMNIGGGLPYFLIFSYYYPRYVLPEISGSIGAGYYFNEKVFANLSIGMINYFDAGSDVNLSISYSLSLGFRIF